MPSFDSQTMLVAAIVALVIATTSIVFAFLGQKTDDRLRGAFDRLLRGHGFAPVHRVPDDALSVLDACGIGNMHGTSSCIRHCWQVNEAGLTLWFALFIPRLIDPPDDNNTLLCFFHSNRIDFQLKLYGDHRRIPSSPLDGGSERITLRDGRTAKYECVPHDRRHCQKAVVVAGTVSRCTEPSGQRPDLLVSDSWACIVGPRLSLLETSADEGIAEFVYAARRIAAAVSDRRDPDADPATAIAIPNATDA